MPRDKQQWKSLQRQGDKGGYVYIPKMDLEKLEREGAIDIEEDIRYSVSVGVSDGRARGFIGLRNAEDD